MGKIFGISDLPVSTIVSPFEQVKLLHRSENELLNTGYKSVVDKVEGDKFVSKNSTVKSNPFVKMRNGVGKLMKHYSKKVVK